MHNMLVRTRGLLVRDEDFEATDYLCQRNRSIVLPVLNSFHVVHKNDIVLFLALVMDFGLVRVSPSHDGRVVFGLID